MNSVFLIISALLPILTQTLQGAKVISPTISALITGIEQAAAAVVAEFSTAGATATPSVTVQTLLAAISGALQVLQTQTKIDPTTLTVIAAVNTSIQAGLTAVNNVTSVDPTALHPIVPV